MKYTSTRSASISCSFEDAICSGYAPDGGLFVPESLPPVSAATLQEWSKLPYPVLSEQVLRLFIAQEEISDADLTKICTSAFRGFPDADNAVPVKKVGSLYIAELCPNLCFKISAEASSTSSTFASQRQRKIALLITDTVWRPEAVSDGDNPC
jgi:threonine synthase